MKFSWLLGITCAVVLHGGFLLFGGIFFLHDDEADHGTLQEVDLMSEDEAPKEEDKPQEKPEDTTETMDTEEEPPPDAAEIMRDMELSAAAQAPALEAASLGAIEQALNGAGGGGAFGDALSFSSGGRIGGMGKASDLEEKIESAFSLAEIDQKPRPIFQAAPGYPAELRSQKVEGVVTVIFVVDASGKVTNPRIEKSSNPAFDKPALDAIRQWKFDPAVRAGQRVPCRMRQPFRFQPS